MERSGNLVNSQMIGNTVEIDLPGWEGKGEKCPIHYLIIGEGTPLLLVHSIGQSMYTWRNMLPYLRAPYQLILLDLPGFGFSGRPVSCDYTMEEMGYAILKFMDALHIEAAHAIGASLGCGYLLSAVEQAPQRFGKLTLLCPGEVTTKMPRRIQQMATPFIGPFARELYGKKEYRRELATAYYDATFCSEEVFREYYKTSDSYASRQSFMYCLRNYDLEVIDRDLDKLEHEIFVVWGEMDRWQPVKYLKWWKKRIQHGYYFTLRNAGHFFWEEKAQQTAEAVDKFIRYQ